MEIINSFLTAINIMSTIISMPHQADIYAKEAVQQATALAIEGRPQTYLHCLSDHGRSPQRAAQRRAERQALTRIKEGLLNYSKGSLEESLNNFLLQTLAFCPTSVIEIPSARSKETTFIVTDGKRELYIRVFCSDKEMEAIPDRDFSQAYNTRDTHFIRQLAAVDLMRTLHLSTAQHQEHLAIGQCTVGGSDYYLVAGPNLPGRDMQSLHAEIFKHPKDSQERADAIAVFKRALTKLAITLGEIHSISATPQEITPDILQAFQSRIDLKLEAYQAAGGSQAKKIRTIVERQLDELAKSQAFLTYHHGSANLKKFFYDVTSDTLAMKELYEAHPSMGKKGEPLGLFAGHDINSPLEDIIFETLRLDEEPSTLTKELCETFNATYRKTVGTFYQPALVQIEQSLRRLERYPGCLNPENDLFKRKSLSICNQLFNLDTSEKPK